MSIAPPDPKLPDALTGLPTRTVFAARAAEAWAATRASGGPLSLVLADIDHCKRFNGCHGHWVGDALIAHVARLCEVDRRLGEVVARVGGELFAVLLPGRDSAEAALAAEALRRLVETRPLAAENGPLAATISLGHAQARPDMAGFDALMASADEALHAAKRAGRNRVHPSGPAPADHSRDGEAA
jgi:diguanylate cyclase (GGDEF)-like protein